MHGLFVAVGRAGPELTIEIDGVAVYIGGLDTFFLKTLGDLWFEII